MSDIVKLALIRWIYGLENVENKTWEEYVIMDTAAIQLLCVGPYKGALSRRFLKHFVDGK